MVGAGDAARFQSFDRCERGERRLWRDVGVYGAKGFDTPHLDRLAHEGIRFTDFHVAQAVCSASRAGIMTGCYPNRIGIEGDLDDLFSFSPLKPGKLDWLLPWLEMYPTALQKSCTVYIPKNKEQAIFLHPGEPVFERFRSYICDRFEQQAMQGAVFVDPTAQRPYLYHLVRVVVARKADPLLRALNREEVLEYRLVLQP